jgi:cation diffusion facilitator family transporter
MTKSNNNSYTETKKVIIVSGILNILLMAYKLIVGYIGNSSAIIADGIHSLSDFLTDIIVMIGVKISAKPVDEDHPYGHGKVETFVSFIIASSLVLVAVGIIYSSVKNMFSIKELKPLKMITLTAVLISVVVKEFLFRYTISVGRKHNLNSLIANAWHHRSDAYSSLAAMAGIIGAMMGYKILDPIAALVVAFLIGKVGVDIGKEAFMDLIDTAADKKIYDQIKKIIRDTKDVVSYHGLKTRKVGNNVISDLQIEVDPAISVVQGHDIAKNLKTKIIDSVKEVENILIHVEPVGDRDGIIYHVERSIINESMIRKAVIKIPGVMGLHALKIHHFGRNIVLNADIEVAPKVTVAEGHKIAKEAKLTLMKLNGNVKDVVIHIDPYRCND